MRAFCQWVQMHEQFKNSGSTSKINVREIYFSPIFKIQKIYFTVKPGQALLPKSPLMNLSFESWTVGSCRFQIHLCILGCVMSREFTRETVMKFPLPHFPCIWCKSLRSNFLDSKIFNLTKYRDAVVEKFSSHYASRNANLNLTLVTGTTNGFLF